MRIEKWEAGAKVERECPKMTEFLVIEGEARDGETINVLITFLQFYLKGCCPEHHDCRKLSLYNQTPEYHKCGTKQRK